VHRSRLAMLLLAGRWPVVCGGVAWAQPAPPAPTPAQDPVAVVQSFYAAVNRQDLNGALALFTDDATVEDPVGSEVRRGRDQIREVYANIENYERASELVTVKVVGNEAAFLIRLT